LKRACALLLLPGMLPLLAVGADFEKCAVIVADVQRLACYDQVAARPLTASPAPVEQGRVSAEQRLDELAVAGSLLGKSWELDENSKNGTFRFREHKTVYILPVHFSNNPNQSPTSPAPDHSALSSLSAASSDVKYPLSFKTKLWE